MDMTAISKDKQPLVSICIPSYNGELLIQKAIESCLSQTYKNIEIVIVDDASKDETERVVGEYIERDPRIHYFKNEKNVGVAANFFKTFELAQGEFIQHLGQDDWLDADYVEKKMDIFKKYPDAAFVSGGIKNYRENNNGELETVNLTRKKEGIYSADFIFGNYYKTKNTGLIGLFCMARRVDMVNNFLVVIPNTEGYDELYRKGKIIDNIVFLRILTKYKFMYYCQDVLYHGRFHGNNASGLYGLSKEKSEDRIKSVHVDLVGLEYFYKNEGKKYLSGFRIFEGDNILGTVLIDIIFRRSGGSPMNPLRNFFKEYTLKEKLATLLILPAHLLGRLFQLIVKI